MVTIREATQGDRESIWLVHTRAIREVCLTHYPQSELQAWAGLLKPTRYQNAIRRGAFFVAVENDVIVGFGNLNQEHGEVEAVYVHPDHVGLGLGMQILQTLESLARDSGLASLHLCSTLNAVPFYEKAGFERQGEKKYLLPSSMIGCVRMVKKLP